MNFLTRTFQKIYVMFELSQEEVLMYSDDRSVTLTTHRVIHQTKHKRTQIMLEDFVKYELSSEHIGVYIVLVSFALIGVVTAIASEVRIYWEMNESFDDFLGLLAYLIMSPLIIWTFIFLFISHFIYLISRRYYLRIYGKYDCIEIRTTTRKSRSTKRFLDALTKASQNIKNAQAKL